MGAGVSSASANTPTDASEKEPKKNIPTVKRSGQASTTDQNGGTQEDSEAHRNQDKEHASSIDDDSNNTSPLSEEGMVVKLDKLLADDKILFKEMAELWEARPRDYQSDIDFVIKMTQYMFITSRVVTSQYNGFGEGNFHLTMDYETRSKSELVRSKCVDLMCDILVDVLQNDEQLKEGVDTTKLQEKREKLLSEVLSTLVGATNNCPEVSRAVCDHPTVVPVFFEKLAVLLQQLKQSVLAHEEDIIFDMLMLTANVSQVGDCQQRVRDCPGCFDLIKSFVDLDDDQFRFLAILALAYIATDEQANSLATNPKMIRILLNALGDAVSSLDHTGSTLQVTGSIEELSHAVKQLSRNDANSRELVKHGAVDILLSGLALDSPGESQVCMEALWWLSFLEENRVQMVQHKQLLDKVIAIYHDKGKYPQCHEAAEGMLFQLVENLQTLDKEKYGPLVKQLTGGKTSPSKSGHVMMSYNRASRPVVKMICDYLKSNGIAVWMDIYNMPEADGSTTQMMAEAVENAVVFLMCVSEGYKDSQYCRQEAEYASKRNTKMARPTIIPLQMQAKYDPDGWLGFLMGNDYFLDFSREELHRDKLGKLLAKVQNIFNEPKLGTGRDRTGTTNAKPVDTSHGGVDSFPSQLASLDQSTRLSSSHLERIRQWTAEESNRWREKFAVKGAQVQSLTGMDLAFLRILKSESPDIFYQLLMTQLKLKTVQELAKFTYALEQIQFALD